MAKLIAEEVKERVGQFIKWYNAKRLHQALGYKTPKEVMGQRAEGLAQKGSSANRRTKKNKRKNASGGKDLKFYRLNV